MSRALGLFVVLCLGCARTETYTPASVRVDAGSPDPAPPPDAGTCPIPWDATMRVTIRMTADDQYRLFVDGTLIDDTVRLWSSPQTYEVLFHTHPSRANVIAIEATNQWKIDGLDRGLVVSFDRPTASTDGAWRLSTTFQPGWESPGFDDRAWKEPAVIGTHGIAPWGAVLGSSSAKWIWSYVPNGTAASKPTLEPVWFRRTLYLQTDGGFENAPRACP